MNVYLQALTHSSWAREHPSGADNERLEFLGDAVLQLCLSDLLYRRFPDKPEGELSRMRQLLVNNERLASLARDLDLGALLRLGRGEDRTGGRNRNRNLAGAYEALLGAVYLDLGVDAAREVVDAAFGPLLDEVVARHNPKQALQEWCQARYKGELPRYEMVRAEGPDDAKIFTIQALVHGEPVGEGRGTSKKQAETEAARKALAKLALD